MILLALLLGLQDVPIVSGRQHTLDQMSLDMSDRVATCGIKVAFIMPRGKNDLDDVKAVIDPAATPEQIACAKGLVSWLASDAEARARGWK